MTVRTTTPHPVRLATHARAGVHDPLHQAVALCRATRARAGAGPRPAGRRT